MAPGWAQPCQTWPQNGSNMNHILNTCCDLFVKVLISSFSIIILQCNIFIWRGPGVVTLRDDSGRLLISWFFHYDLFRFEGGDSGRFGAVRVDSGRFGTIRVNSGQIGTAVHPLCLCALVGLDLMIIGVMILAVYDMIILLDWSCALKCTVAVYSVSSGMQVH